MSTAINNAPARRAKLRAGFSLIEMLVVVAILGLVAMFALPALNQVTDSQSLTQATDLVISQLTHARHQAIAHNRNVEVRFYRFKGDAEEKRYQALQTFLATEDPTSPWRALGRIQRLPRAICFASGTSLSPLIAEQTPRVPNLPVKGLEDDSDYVSLTFRPDGSAIPASTMTHLTLLHTRLPDSSDALPANFSVIQIFPPTGFMRSFRP